MSTEYHEIEIWIAYDICGDSVIRTDRDSVIEAWEDEIGSHPFYVRCLNTKVPVPVEPVQSVTLPDDSSVEEIQVEETSSN